MYRKLVRAVYYLTALILLATSLPHLVLAQTAPTLTVDAAGNPHPINPDIYGIASYGLDANFAKEIQVPNIRWGGDGTTRYNWQVDSSNAGFDWYFMGGNGETAVTPSGSADLMVNTYKTASNAKTLLAIPIIPWVNKSAAWSCSFPVSIYGAQQSTNPYVHPNGDSCGNSIATNGTQLFDTNVYANHVDNTVALQQGWVQHMVSTFGTAANGGVPYYQLDNEPGGWSNTHRDVEPVQPDYDTIISLGQQYAAMIKQTDPSAKVFGPVDFTLGGWIGTPAKQDNLFAGQYYLQQMAAYDAANHERILDYFDEHYYGGGSTDAAELADTRSLWDPTYNSGTWVEQFYFDGPMNLLPRFQNWIQTYYPGTKLSISEYSFAMGTNPLVDMLTEADVLGIYGRQNLDFANMWNVPKPTDPLAYSFRIYRNFDGAGGQFGDTSVNSTSTDQGQLSVYGALRSSDGALTVVVINKTTSAIQTSLSLANFSATAAAVFTYSNANLAQIVAGSPVSFVSNSVSYNFPAYSATVFVFTPAAPTLIATTTSLVASSTTPITGQSLKFTASVGPKSGSGSPTGTVTFSDSGTELGTGTVNSDTASFSTSSLGLGSHSITASYSGDTNFAVSTSSALSVTVSPSSKTATTVSVSSSATQLTTGQMLVLNIAVASKTGTGTPTGTVAVFDGQTQLAVPTLLAGAASFSTSTLAAGTHSITVDYSGDTNFAASVSGSISIMVSAPAKINTVTALSASATQITAGGSIAFTAKVTPQTGSGTATGMITFLDGQTQVGSAPLAGGSGQFTTASLAATTHSISATYSGDANYNASNSAVITITVSAAPIADYSLSLGSSALGVFAGASGTMTVTVTPKNGFKQAVTFSCSGAPAGASCAFNPQSVSTGAGAASTILTIQTPVAATGISAKSPNANDNGGFRSEAPNFSRIPGSPIAAFYVVALGFFGIFGLCGTVSKKHSLARGSRLVQCVAASAVLAATIVTASCAGTVSEKEQPPPTNQYTITVTGSGANAPTRTQTFTLTVTQ